MYILSYATANFDYSAAILQVDSNGVHTEVIAYTTFNDEPNNIAKFVPIIDDLMQSNKISYQDIVYTAVATGPGSFTGIRTGLAFAHGLHLSTNIKTIGINSFDIMATKAACNNAQRLNIAVILESRRRDKYFQLYDANLQILKPAALLMPEELTQYISSNMLVTGNGSAIISIKNIIDELFVPTTFDARDVGRYACDIINSGNYHRYPLVPFYIHSLQSYKTINKL